MLYFKFSSKLNLEKKTLGKGRISDKGSLPVLCANCYCLFAPVLELTCTMQAWTHSQSQCDKTQKHTGYLMKFNKARMNDTKLTQYFYHRHKRNAEGSRERERASQKGI